MKIFLEIYPAFLSSSIFDLQKEILTIRINAAQEKSWSFAIDEKAITALTLLTQEIIEEARPDTRIILDGVSLKCGFETAAISKEYEFRCPDLNTKELELPLTYLDLVARLNTDSNLNNYLELVEGYFVTRLPLKEFDEDPYRLRIYGTWSIYEKEGLAEAINRLSQKEYLVLDMRNFQGMGRALHECFEPLKRVKNLRILANGFSFDLLISMGFKGNQIERE